MGKMLKNEVAKNELKEVRHSEEWHKSGEKVKYRLADAMKSCMKKAPGLCRCFFSLSSMLS